MFAGKAADGGHVQVFPGLFHDLRFPFPAPGHAQSLLFPVDLQGFPVHPGLFAAHIGLHFQKGIAVFFIQPPMPGGNVCIFLSHDRRETLRVGDELPRVPVAPVLREGVHETDPGRKVRRLNIIQGRERAEGHQAVRFLVNEQGHQCRPACQLLELPVTKKPVQVLPSAPVAFSDFLQPVLRFLRCEILNNLHGFILPFFGAGHHRMLIDC